MLLPPRLGALALAFTIASCSSSTPGDGRWNLSLDNDAFTGTDNNYTNGLSFGWASNERDDLAPDSALGGWIDLWSWLPLMDDPESDNFASFALGQEVYTAYDIKDPNPGPNEQPYAGVLYFDTGLHTFNDDVRVDWNLRLGIVGPSSGAEEVQKEFHELIDVATPQGWHTQLPDELVLNVDSSLGKLLIDQPLSEDTSVRVGTVGSLSLGNYFTGVGGVLYTELGWNLPETFGGPRLRGGLASISPIGPRGGGPGAVSLFVSGAGYGIGHFLPLDGTVTKDSHSVETYPFVGALRGGISLRWSRFGVRFHLTHASKAFEGQKDKTDYGTFSFVWIP